MICYITQKNNLEEEMEIRVSTELCAVLIGFANSIGIETNSLLRKVQLNSELLKDTFDRLELDKFRYLWEEIIEKSNNNNQGLIFGSGYALRTGGILKTILLNCKDLEEALDKFILYHIINAEINQFELITDGNRISLIITPYCSDILFSRHINESILATIVKTFVGLSGGKLVIDEIHFAHEAPKDISMHKEVFNTELCFDEDVNKIVFNKQELALPIAYSNRQLLDSLQQYADKLVNEIKTKNKWSLQVERFLTQILLNGDKPNIDLIAKNLYLSTRNLQYKLKLESTSYQFLLERVRKSLSLKLIENPEVTINDLAFLMSFSDQSAFCNSFKKWAGKSPLEYRKEIFAIDKS